MSNFKQKRWALWFLLLSGVLTLSSSQNVPAAVTALTAGVNIQMRIAVNASDLVLSQVHKDQIAQFFATQTRAACAPLSCTVQPATDIIFTSVSGGTLTFTRAANGTFTNASHTHEFSVVMRIMLPDNSRALAVKASSNDILKAQGLSQRQLEPNLSDDPALGVTLLAYSVEYTRDGGRPLVCGDSMVTGIEVCDDGNVVDGDGCSSNCTLEPGFMCNNAFRIDVGNATNAITPGFMSAWTTDAATGIKSLVVSSVRETCTKDDICVQGASWNKNGGLRLIRLCWEAFRFLCSRLLPLGSTAIASARRHSLQPNITNFPTVVCPRAETSAVEANPRAITTPIAQNR